MPRSFVPVRAHPGNLGFERGNTFVAIGLRQRIEILPRQQCQRIPRARGVVQIHGLQS